LENFGVGRPERTRHTRLADDSCMAAFVACHDGAWNLRMIRSSRLLHIREMSPSGEKSQNRKTLVFRHPLATSIQDPPEQRCAFRLLRWTGLAPTSNSTASPVPRRRIAGNSKLGAHCPGGTGEHWTPPSSSGLHRHPVDPAHDQGSFLHHDPSQIIRSSELQAPSSQWQSPV
jgi:hypothetical protein